jgi:hypothetical protein
MGLRRLHTFDVEYASAFGILKALFALTRRKQKTEQPFPYVAQFACREGVWLAAAKALGTQRVMGVDTKDALESVTCLEPGEFNNIDLASVKVALPLKADLLICVEYTHLLNTERAKMMVEDMCSSSDKILFSAGIPYQVHNQDLNLRWPSYWAKQFYERGFLPDLKLREMIWSDPGIDPLFRQNCVLYTRAAKMPRKKPDFLKLDVVHPGIYEVMQAKQQALAMQLTRTTIRKLMNKKS